MDRITGTALVLLLAAPCVAQVKGGRIDPTRIDSDLLWNVRDRIIQRGHPEPMSDMSLQDCLTDAVGTREATMAACLDADQVLPAASNGGTTPAVLRYVIRDLTLTVQDGSEHYIFVVSPTDKIKDAVHLDENGAPSSADVSTPKVREILLRALRKATGLPLIEA